MNLWNKIKIVYMFGEYEGDFKRLLKKEWLNQTETKSVLHEFETIKSDYDKVCENFNVEESKHLIMRMKKMPIIGLTTKKEKFMVKIQNWISHFDFKSASNVEEKIQKSKNQPNNNEGAKNSKKKIKSTPRMSITKAPDNSKSIDIKTEKKYSMSTKSESLIPKSENQLLSNYIEKAYNLNLEMVFVERGTFWMGAQSSDYTKRNYDKNANDRTESPVHKVTISGFFIAKYEVTQEQWVAVMGTNPSQIKGKNFPVTNVSWIQVQKFINKLNKKTELNYRLPTEAEWEYAAKGGNKSKGYKYSGSNSAHEVGWTQENGEYELHSVGLKLPNELGLYDMTGNVLEWCHDWWCAYKESSQINPFGTESSSKLFVNSGAAYCCRGGCSYFMVDFCRNSFRYGDSPNDETPYRGFRIILPQ